MCYFLGLTFNEVGAIKASGSKVVCCHFSPDGKLLASGGHDKKVRTISQIKVYVLEVLNMNIASLYAVAQLVREVGALV